MKMMKIKQNGSKNKQKQQQQQQLETNIRPKLFLRH